MWKKIIFWNSNNINFKNVSIFQLVLQTITLGIFAFIFMWFFNNYVENISSRNIKVGLDFLNDTAGFSIGQSLIEYSDTDSYFRVYLVGLLNTCLASLLAIGLATILGFFFGICLLVDNLLLVKIAQAYVEIIRNIPPLLQVFFWYTVVILKVLPDYDNSINIANSMYINVRGITFPALSKTSYVGLFWVMALLVVIGSIIIRNISLRQQREGHARISRLWQVFIWGLLLVTAIIFKPYLIELPVQGKFRFVKGFTLFPELFALVLALAVYTSTYIATIVRSSILSISKVQIEAAQSLGLNFYQRLRYVIIPLALRSMIPPLANQYLNITKNSSLGIAIGYPELVAVYAGTSLNQSGRVIEIMTMVMLTYFCMSIFTSFLMNIYNKKVLQKVA